MDCQKTKIAKQLATLQRVFNWSRAKHSNFNLTVEEHLVHNSADWPKHQRHSVNDTVDKNDGWSRWQAVVERK